MHYAYFERHLLKTNTYPEHKLLNSNDLPNSLAIDGLAKGLQSAHEAYGASRSQPSLPLCVLFVVQDPERNIFDQRPLEYWLNARRIKTFRLPFSQTLTRTKVVDSSGRALIYTPAYANTTYEVSTIYFRATYSPDDFVDEDYWTARYQLERSAAIKCPSVLTHLAGTKKVQQVLATPSSPHISRFISNPETADRVRGTFAAIYPLDDSEAGKHAKALALDPETAKGYVLKPQREGGGNNVYRSAIPSFLKNLGPEAKWRGHILMEIIEPPLQWNMIVREGQLRQGEVIAELGVYGTCLWNGQGVQHNSGAGYLLRTKGSDSEEGGVAAGFGSIDSVLLVDT